MVLGAGLCPAGLAFDGFGSPDTPSPILGSSLELANANGSISQSTGDASYINPQTGDYLLDTNGQLVGMSSVAQQVYLALITQLGTSANPTVGSTLYKLTTITNNFQSKVKLKINLALSNLIKAGTITLNSSNVTLTKQFNNTVTAIIVNWTDNTTGNSFSTVLS